MSDDPIATVRDRAHELYMSRELLCSEAVLVAADEVYGCGLGRERAVALASALPVGLGGRGCLCGALSGAAVALGLVLALTPAPLSRKSVRAASARLHDLFREAHGATCCRALTKAVKHDRKAHFSQCAGLTAQAAESLAALVAELRPDLTGVGAARAPGARSGLALVRRLVGRMGTG